MAALLFRLFALLSLVLMPLGMTGAAAAAEPVAAADSSRHCGSQGEPEQAPLEQMDAQCMACAGLPATDASGAHAQQLPDAPRLIALASRIRGIILEIATPPPKFA